ncbi:MAG: hypothetical protein AABX51_05435 [Nanoarchaeota archaeon]
MVDTNKDMQIKCAGCGKSFTSGIMRLSAVKKGMVCPDCNVKEAKSRSALKNVHNL